MCVIAFDSLKYSKMNKFAADSPLILLMTIVVVAATIVSASPATFKRQVAEDNTEQLPDKVKTLF